MAPLVNMIKMAVKKKSLFILFINKITKIQCFIEVKELKERRNLMK